MPYFQDLIDMYEKNIASLTMQSNGIVIEANSYYLKLLEKNKKDVLGKHITEFDFVISEEGTSTFKKSSYGHYHSQLLNEENTPIEVIFVHRGKKNEFVTLFVKNLSYLHEAKYKLSFLSKIFSESKEAVMVTDELGHILCVNESYRRITGYSNEESLGQTPALLNSGKQDKTFYRKFWQDLTSKGNWKGEIWNKRKNGEIFPEWVNISSIRDENQKITNYICQFSDITTLKKSAEEKHFLTYYDPLTCLPNRNLLFEKLTDLCKLNTVKSSPFAVVFCDLDRFKLINDTYGHHVGDELLKCIANRFEARLREDDLLARSGDDEFIVIVQGKEALDNLNKICHNILSVFDQPFGTKHGTYDISISLGVSQFPIDSIDVRELISFADIAMYKSKQLGGNQFTIFDGSEKTLVRQQHLLEQDIKVALVKNQFEVWYQPQINSANRAVYGVECLLRWNHPVHGIISPDIFIPILESNGLIKSVGLFVIETACTQIALWNKHNIYNGIAAINVSVRQFEDDKFVEKVACILTEYQVKGASIELEVTESLFSENNHHLIPVLSELRKLGVKIAIDDFGTGYSSLQRLKTLPIDNVKIDKCFVDNIVNSKEDSSIINALILISKTFRLSLVAEGIETQHQADMLNYLGCFNHQGFLYSKPLQVKDFEIWLPNFKPECLI